MLERRFGVFGCDAAREEETTELARSVATLVEHAGDEAFGFEAQGVSSGVELPLRGRHGSVAGKDVVIQRTLLRLRLAAKELALVLAKNCEVERQGRGLAPAGSEPGRRVRGASSGCLEREQEIVHPRLWMPEGDEPELQQLRHQAPSPLDGGEGGESSASRTSWKRL